MTDHGIDKVKLPSGAAAVKWVLDNPKTKDEPKKEPTTKKPK